MRAFLHHQVWQRLPRGPRRAALFAATRTLAPPISADATPCEPIIVAGPLRTSTGLGQSARLCYEAFRAYGVRAYAIDLTTALGQPVDIPDYAFEDGRDIVGAGTLILHVNSPFVPLALLKIGRAVVEGKWVIGYWHWELPEAPPDWRHGLNRVHEIWAPSTFTASAVKTIARNKTIRVLPHPVALGFQSAPPPRATGAELTAMLAFNMASGFTRKNPLASIAAFEAAFGNDPQCKLIVKVAHAEIYPEGHQALRAALQDVPNGELIDRIVDSATMKALYAQTDVVMSLHRSEGFGLVVAEAMLSARPALSTDWSSTTDFLTPETGMPVSYHLVPARDPQNEYDQPSQKWAEADIDDAAAKLTALRDPALRKALGEAAQADAIKRFSAQAYVEQVFKWFGQPLPAESGHGAR